MASDSEQIEALDAAEGYRRQRQAADARKSGAVATTREEYLKWMRDNRATIIEIAKRAGADDGDAEKTADRFLELLENQSDKSEFDDLGAIFLLNSIVDRVETACRKLEVPVRNGVVFGVSRLAGVVASQMPVLKTDTSIIEVTLPFITFCDLISKVLAHTFVDQVNATFDLSPASILGRLNAEPWIVEEWLRVLVSYAMEGTPPAGLGPAPEGRALGVRALLLDAMEVFTIAHEYGHHALKHGITEASISQESPFDEEHEADIFARIVSVAVSQLDPNAPDVFLVSGAGGALILGALDLVARGREMLETGADCPPPRKHHPPVRERIDALDQYDMHVLATRAEEFAGFRMTLLDLFDVVWDAVKPKFEQMHRDGHRPLDNSSGPIDWLPLA
ncbi:hypothetical protein V1282_005280 [Nitrobacteraceae bacterium AZCC 2146]